MIRRLVVAAALLAALLVPAPAAHAHSDYWACANREGAHRIANSGGGVRFTAGFTAYNGLNLGLLTVGHVSPDVFHGPGFGHAWYCNASGSTHLGYTVEDWHDEGEGGGYDVAAIDTNSGIQAHPRVLWEASPTNHRPVAGRTMGNLDIDDEVCWVSPTTDRRGCGEVYYVDYTYDDPDNGDLTYDLECANLTSGYLTEPGDSGAPVMFKFGNAWLAHGMVYGLIDPPGPIERLQCYSLVATAVFLTGWEVATT